MYLYKVISVDVLATDISQINLKPLNIAFSYQAGQYIQVLHNNGEISPLSIACAPNKENHISFHLFHPPENLKAKDLLKTAINERIWRIEGPFGECTASRLAKDKEILFFAYGTGYAPIKAIIEEMMVLSSRPKMDLIWWMPNQSTFYLPKDIATWQKAGGLSFVQFDYTLSTMEGYLMDLSNRQVYVAGPKSIVQFLYKKFVVAGLPSEAFFSDLR